MSKIAYSPIAYSAVVLNEESQTKLKEFWARHAQNNKDISNKLSWKVFCHHATICMGKLPPELKSAIGQQIAMDIFNFSSNERVAAFRVIEPKILSGLISNKHFHITVATNTGVKPVESNILLDSQDINDVWTISPISGMGTIEEVIR